MAAGLGTFRTVNRGDVEIEVNSTSVANERFLESENIRTRDQWRPSPDPRKPGRVVQVRETLGDSARQAGDALKHRSILRDDSVAANENGDCCVPSYYGNTGPLTKLRGDE